MKSGPAVICLGMVMLGCGISRAGEQVQFKGSTSVELPKPKRILENNRHLNSDPERPSLDGGFVAPPLIDRSSSNDRKMREELDRKKNWMFMNPYEERFDSKTEEFLKGEKGTGLYDNKWMTADEEKNAVQKFLEEKDQRRENERGERDEKLDRDPDKDSLLPSERDETKSKPEDNLSFLNPKTQFDGPIFRDGVDGMFGAGSLERKLERNPLSENPFGPRKGTLSSIEKDEIKQKQIEHEKEFDKILQTRLGTGQTVGRLNTLTTGPDFGRVDTTAPGRRTELSTFGRSAGPTTANFTDGGGSFGLRPAIESRSSFGDTFGAPVAKPATPFAPAPTSRPTVNESPGLRPAPFSLPFPQRKF